MSLIVTALVLQLLTWSEATNITEEASTNKTKRTIGTQVQNFGENRPVVLYQDNAAAGAVPPQHLAGSYPPVKPLFEPEAPKQVAAQQVLYEFQQTPTNAVSNVHVNQYYQPVANKPEQPNPNPAPYESVATPVQHSTLVRHGHNFAQVQYHPQHVQTQHYVPGKYLYVNGKIVYQPSQQQQLPHQQQQLPHQQQQQQQLPHQQQQLPHQQQQLPHQQQHHQPQAPQQQKQILQQNPVNYFTYQHPQTYTHKFLTPPPLVRPINTYRRFHPPQPAQLQPITKPMNTPEVKEEQNEEPEEETVTKTIESEDVEEENEEPVEEEEEEEEEEDDHVPYFSKYHSFEDDDDDDHYREIEDEDEDSERGSSRTITKKQKKKTIKPKYSKHKYEESYNKSKKSKKIPKNPKTQHKSVKYTKESNSKPRLEKLEGKQSQHIPVVHQHKLFSEKWYVTKSTDDSTI